MSKVTDYLGFSAFFFLLGALTLLGQSPFTSFLLLGAAIACTPPIRQKVYNSMFPEAGPIYAGTKLTYAFLALFLVASSSILRAGMSGTLPNQTAGKTKPAATAKPAASPKPAAKPKTKATTKPKQTAAKKPKTKASDGKIGRRGSGLEWYENGNLHKLTGAEWIKGTPDNRLATAADFSATHKEPASMDEMRTNAAELKDCLDEVFKAKEAHNQKVIDVATLCVMMMD